MIFLAALFFILTAPYWVVVGIVRLVARLVRDYNEGSR